MNWSLKNDQVLKIPAVRNLTSMKSWL